MNINKKNLILIAAFVTSGCEQPGIEVSEATAPETAMGAAPGATVSGHPAAQYRSAKIVSTDCAIPDVVSVPPGFAEPLGAPQKELPPPLAKNMAVGADRESVATDWDRVSAGYVLVEPLAVWDSTIINNEGEVVGTIKSDYDIEFSRFLPNGNRFVSSHGRTDVFIDGGGRRGCLEEYSPERKLLWRLGLNTNHYIQHHDAVKMPNGNILTLVWENVPVSHAISLGRNPENVAENGQFWYDGVIEVNPYTAEIVWEWSMRDHLIQDFDSTKPYFGVVAEHPELLDINAHIKQPDGSVNDDWTHANALDYNVELDQIIWSSNYLSEVYVIDHSTTPWEAADHSGGNHGKGGDLLYRWGNPANYGRGTEEDRTLFHQHDIHWIKDGLPGAGNLLVFNNGNPLARPYSTVIEFAPEMNSDGSYVLNGKDPYGPGTIVWEYDPQPPERFFSFFISGAQRMENGNTLITQGAGGKIREITPTGEIVWDYTYTNEVDAPHMLFRGNRYPVDHPGIAPYLAQQ